MGSLRRAVATCTLIGSMLGLASAHAATLGRVRSLAFPAAPGSAEPFLAADPGGKVYATWLEPAGRDRHALRFSSLDGTRWSKPATIAEGDSFFVNWADFPVLLARGDGRLAVSWPWKSGGDPYAYDVRIAQSFDDGKSWTAPVVPHRDGTRTEHGFVALAPEGDAVRAVWLDGRKFADRKGHGGGHDEEGGADMTLRTARIDRDGRLSDERELDGRTCDCCQTDIALAGDAVLVAYRDRGDDEMRDISLVRRERDAWSAPGAVHADGWKIPGCPVNGPALAAEGNRVVAAWFTEANETPAVRLVRSQDGGKTFADPVRVDEPGAGKGPLGRVDVALGEDSALVLWLQAEGGGARILAREISALGTPEPAITIAFTSSARASGFPRMVRAGDRVVFAWTQAGKPSRIRAAVASWSDSPLR